MLDLLFNHSPAFVGGELLLALSLGMFGFALIGAARDRYSVRIPLARMRNRFTSLRPTFGVPPATSPGHQGSPDKLGDIRVATPLISEPSLVTLKSDALGRARITQSLRFRHR
jgi:hypothetical protein